MPNSLEQKAKYGPYSHSRIKVFEECKFKFKLKYIDKISKFSNAPHFIKGKYYHTYLEHWPNIENKFKNPNEEWNKHLKELVLKEDIKTLLETTVKREQCFNLDNNFEPSTKSNALITGFIDIISLSDRTLVISDWKTGKSKADFSQLKLYSIWCAKAFKKIDNFKLALVYLEQDKVDSSIHTREDILLHEKEIKTKINKIESETNFDRNINEKCQNCDYFSECNPIKYKLDSKSERI